LSTGFRTFLELTKISIVALSVLHNIAIMLKDREFTIQVIEEQEQEPLRVAEEQNPRGSVRAAFIQNNF